MLKLKCFYIYIKLILELAGLEPQTIDFIVFHKSARGAGRSKFIHIFDKRKWLYFVLNSFKFTYFNKKDLLLLLIFSFISY